jgi:hypothetical protein
VVRSAGPGRMHNGRDRVLFPLACQVLVDNLWSEVCATVAVVRCEKVGCNLLEFLRRPRPRMLMGFAIIG